MYNILVSSPSKFGISILRASANKNFILLVDEVARMEVLKNKKLFQLRIYYVMVTIDFRGAAQNDQILLFSPMPSMPNQKLVLAYSCIYVLPSEW